MITTVHGRATHLRGQLDGLALSAHPADLHVVVAVDDLSAADTVARSGAPAHIVCCAGGSAALPVAAARNAGAAAALEHGADLLVFLDVDCIPGRHLVGRYREAASQPPHRDALLCGPVTYLPPPGPGGYPVGDVDLLAAPHPARPAPRDDEILVSTAYELFWSLSFALTTSTWRRIGGFCTLYRGYGGEDTDFAQTAAALGVTMRWVGGADAFHQFHPVSDPPTEHLEDIVRNAAVFHRRWGWWPMTGWLQAFEERGLIARDDAGRPHLL